MNGCFRLTMNKETRYLYVMSPSFGSGSMLYTAIALPDYADGAAEERDLARQGRLSTARANQSRWRSAWVRFSQTLHRWSHRVMRRRIVQSGAAA